MKTVTGYLTEVSNPHFSGLATVRVRTALVPRKNTRVITCYCEAGFGVRQLVGAFGDGRGFSKASGRIKARFTISDTGLLQSVEPLADPAAAGE